MSPNPHFGDLEDIGEMGDLFNHELRVIVLKFNIPHFKNLRGNANKIKNSTVSGVGGRGLVWA